jgi:cbb3-type cytochrome oxidase cytochrome c subunit
MRVNNITNGWRGAALVALTYIYFLIFAQFGFLARLTQAGIEGTNLRLVMGSMAAGGILLSLAVPRLRIWPQPALRLRLGFGIAAVGALAALLPPNTAGAALTAFIIGAGLGIVTVTLVTHLPQFTSTHRPILKVGFGVGLGYFVCNLPFVFEASPRQQSVLATFVCVAALALPLRAAVEESIAQPTGVQRLPFAAALGAFTALIWLDSAAFYIIQHTRQLKAETWMGSAHLWTNGCLHFAAAVAAALLLERSRTRLVLAGAYLALATACILLLDPAHALSASLLYPIGVSLYSVALVVYPSWLASAVSGDERARIAGWIYALAGWIGSALGIGMGQNLGHVPVAFVVVAGAAALALPQLELLRYRAREVALVGAVLGVAFVAHRAIDKHPAAAQLSIVEAGRRIYISEGCIHCHSQYVRPNSADVALWGPVEPIEEIRHQRPPLIGNRRQGPDLTQVGMRRSAWWLKAHLLDPAALSPGSVMPSYAVLFRDERGDQVVAYLVSLQSSTLEQQRALQRAWQPVSTPEASTEEGEQLYAQLCATCHEPHGAARQRWPQEFILMPTSLVENGLGHSYNLSLASVIKFGVPGTDMPGHEYLSDQQIASLVLWLAHNPVQPQLQR